MMYKAAAVLATISSLANAAAMPSYPKLHVRQTSVTPINSTLANVTIFTTGGTIAGSDTSDLATIGYTSGAVAIGALIEAVPELVSISNVYGVQVSNIDSGSINSTILLKLNSLITSTLADPLSTGAVVTHGTDTLEETAFFLDLTISSPKPVVVVGAMRPSTALSADGPLNLYQAVKLAASPSAVGRGTMVTLNDRITSAFYVVKNHANALDTFFAREQGHLGFFLDQQPNFYYEAAKPTAKPIFDIASLNLTRLPQVDILFGHQDSNPELIRASAASGAEGIVFAGTGAGGWTEKGVMVAEQVANATGIPMVFSTRTMNGFVGPETGEMARWSIASSDLDPQKARILLQCALATGMDTEEIKDVFAALQVQS